MVEVTIPGLDVRRVIAEGPDATVVEAFDARHDRRLALKVFHVADIDRPAFQEQVRTIGRLGSHLHIAPLLGGGFTNEGRPFVAMPLRTTGTAAQRMQRSDPWRVDEVLDAGVKLAAALEATHRGGMLHRRINPSNVFLDDHGSPQLADCAIPATTPDRAVTTTSRDATRYVAPEVVEPGDHSVRSDLYSLGATLFSLLDLAAPGDDPADQRLRAAVPDGLQRVVRRLMAVEPADRPASAAEVVESLQQVQQSQGLPLTWAWVGGDSPATPPGQAGTAGGPAQSSSPPPAPVAPAEPDLPRTEAVPAVAPLDVPDTVVPSRSTFEIIDDAVEPERPVASEPPALARPAPADPFAPGPPSQPVAGAAPPTIVPGRGPAAAVTAGPAPVAAVGPPPEPGSGRPSVGLIAALVAGLAVIGLLLFGLLRGGSSTSVEVGDEVAAAPTTAPLPTAVETVVIPTTAPRPTPTPAPPTPTPEPTVAPAPAAEPAEASGSDTADAEDGEDGEDADADAEEGEGEGDEDDPDAEEGEGDEDDPDATPTEEPTEEPTPTTESIPLGSGGLGNLRVGGTVLRPDGGGAVGTGVSVFVDAGGGRRGALVASAGVDERGRYGFNLSRGCYVLQFAPPDTLRAPDGGTVYDRAVCTLPDAGAIVDVALGWAPRGQGTITGSVGFDLNSQPAPDLQVQLFASADDGSRGGLVATATTNPGGIFTFTPTVGCYVVVASAPDNFEFTTGGESAVSARTCIEVGTSSSVTFWLRPG